jgi:hypothetical protein
VIRNLVLYPASGDPQGQGGHDGIVVHTVSVSIEDCYITGMKRHGILIESGTVGLAGINGVEGSTTLPAGTSIFSHAWRLSRVWLTICGAQLGEPNSGTVPGGSGFRGRGADTNGGVAIGCFVQRNNITYNDETNSGTWIGCYSEASAVGFDCASAGFPIFVGCFSEDIMGGRFSGGQTALVVGGTLVATSNALEKVGVLRSRLTFSDQRTDTPVVTYGANIPAAGRNAALEFWHNSAASGWSLAYTVPGSGSAPYPYLSNSWRWLRASADGVQTDPSGAPFGWTEAGNPRGVALPFIANPLLNTVRRWTWKQTGITLRSGANIIYLFGGTINANEAQFAQDAKSFAPLSDTRVTVDVQLSNITDLNASDIYVGAHTFVSQSSSKGQIAVKIYNNGSNAVVATLVWHFEAYVTNGLTIG